MSLQMILGASGTGKSEYIYQKITEEACSHKDKRFFVIVPDQFTMQTQVDMVTKSGERGGIMNIDVLSFSRLAHRIYEETGAEGKLVLDDTGKSLILRKIAGDIKDTIPYIGANLKRDGFIGEVKSVISEFMQYGVGPEDVNELIAATGGKGMIATKLNEIKTIYAAFMDYIRDTYITSEESMDVLARELDKSELIKGSVVCLDGFTGFTPVQMKVLRKLMVLCEIVYITLTLEEGKENCAQEDLFWFTSKSYKTIIKAADECGVNIEKNEYLRTNMRFVGKADLLRLEENVFRYTDERASKDVACERISIYEAIDIPDEVRRLAMSIRQLASEGVQYRDIAVVTGNMVDYENHIERVFTQFDIPAYIDKTHALVMNPFVEYTKSLFQMLLNDFDGDSVIRFLRCGIGNFFDDDVDLFENFILMSGIRGHKKYEQVWAFAGKKRSVFANPEIMERVNNLKDTINNAVEPFMDENIGRNSVESAKKLVETLYKCYTDVDMYGQLDALRKSFEEKEDYTREREYAQVYRLTMQLLEQIHGLLGDEKLSLEEFARIIEAGFDEITVGTIPQSVDRVIVGDIERSRLKPVKYLFFLGVNDNAIPKKGTTCNLLSDMEREKLGEKLKETNKDISLAPTPREKMYIQRFYLYNNLVKPSERLFISYSLMSGDGKSIRPAYIVHMIKDLFKDLEVLHRNDESSLVDVYNYSELKEFICDRLRKHGEVGLEQHEMDELMQAISLMNSETHFGEHGKKELLELMINNSFFRYMDNKLNAKIAGIIYGETLLSNITKMEQFAKCAYSYFLQYGLSLEERRMYAIDGRGMGNIFHGVIEKYGEELKKRNMSWLDIDDDTSSQIIEEQLKNYIDEVGSSLNDSKTGEFIKRKMSGVLHKAVSMLTYHLRSGEFNISDVEMSFKSYNTLDEINVALDKQERMEISGRIDRIDTCEKQDKIYVKIIDYKSGDKDFELVNFYHGTQLQLVVYMSEGIKHVSRKNRDKEVLPAAILYYHVADEAVNVGTEQDIDKINARIKEELRTKGLVNSDGDIVRALDKDVNGKSLVIPVNYKNDSSITGSVMNTENFKILEEYAQYKLRNLGNDIITGKITKNPCTDGDRYEACTYCNYREVCGFERKLEGYEMKLIRKETDEVLIGKMKQEMEEE